MIPRKKIEFANTLRGIAAISVLIAHYLGVFWVAPQAVASLTNAPAFTLEEIPTPIYVSYLNMVSIVNLNYGAFGVGLFFLVSGFVIPISLEKKHVFDFIVNRILRIYPTYIIGFSITLLAVVISCHYFATQWPYTKEEVFFHFIPGARDLLWSKHIDGIVWTLEVELKFYLICAVFIFLFKKRSMLVFLLPVLLSALGMYAAAILPEIGKTNAWLYIKLLTFIYPAKFIVFMFIGVSLYYWHTGRISYKRTIVLAATFFLLFFLMWKNGPESASISVIYSYAYALAFFVLAMLQPKVFHSNRITDFLANISYPLYVIHGVSGYVMLRIFMDLHMPPMTALIIVLSVVLTASWIIHAYIEKPSQKLTKFLEIKKEASIDAKI